MTWRGLLMLWGGFWLLLMGCAWIAAWPLSELAPNAVEADFAARDGSVMLLEILRLHRMDVVGAARGAVWMWLSQKTILLFVRAALYRATLGTVAGHALKPFSEVVRAYLQGLPGFCLFSLVRFLAIGGLLVAAGALLTPLGREIASTGLSQDSLLFCAAALLVTLCLGCSVSALFECAQIGSYLHDRAIDGEQKFARVRCALQVMRTYFVLLLGVRILQGAWRGTHGALTAALCLSEFPAAGTGLLTMMLLGVSVAVEWFWVVTAAKKITNVRMS